MKTAEQWDDCEKLLHKADSRPSQILLLQLRAKGLLFMFKCVIYEGADRVYTYPSTRRSQDSLNIFQSNSLSDQ